MRKYNKEKHQIGIISDAIQILRKSINSARQSVNERYLSKEISLYEMTNQLWIFDFFDKFLNENLIKNGLGLISLLELYEHFPYPTLEEQNEFQAMRFYLVDMVGVKMVELEEEKMESEGI